jgi:hypothetical protein
MACLLLAAPAHAQTSIDGADMEIDVGDAGDLDASFNTDGFGQLLPFGSAGLQIDVAGHVNDIGELVPDAAHPQTQSGSGAFTDPYRVETQFFATDASKTNLLHVTQDLSHANGDPHIVLHTVVQNISGITQDVRAIEWGEVAGGGFASGAGTFSDAAPRYIAGVFPTTASISGLEELTHWDHYQEADDADLGKQLSDPATGLNDTFSLATQDSPAVGAEWDNHALAAGDSLTFDVTWRFVPGAAHIDLEPGDGSGPLGQLACFTATVTDVYGRPVVTPIDFSAGDPHPDLDTSTDAGGHAAYCVSAAEPGEELFVDASVSDALLDAFSTWTFAGGPDDTTTGTGAPSEPVAGSRLTARVVAGKVRLRHGTRYTTLTGSQSIKVGSTLDARHGTVELTALVGTHEQTARFGAGFFRVRQATASAPVAVTLAGAAFGPACRPGSHKVVRRLRATADRGRWQTVGRRSVAGVTKAASWVTQDRCDGTLTVVRTGTAGVRGAHGHTFTVRAGHRRLVRARSG